VAKGEFLGEFEQLVLLALIRLEDEAYGMAVRREIEERADRNVSIGAVYATLDRLEEKGLVKSRMGEPTDARGGRAKKCFTITAAGARALERSQQAVRQMLVGLPARWNPSR
jgi:DNA-binding PadR family transcriptional regulator